MTAVKSPLKLKVYCVPLLEDKNFEHHYEYDHPFLNLHVEMPEDYPFKKPRFHFETTHGRVFVGSNLGDLKDDLNDYLEAFSGETCVMEMIEYVRVSTSLKLFSFTESNQI